MGNFGDILQLVIVELIYKVCLANPNERSRFIRCIYNLLNSQSAAVRYEAAGTLVTLSTAPTAVKAAASAYIDLIVKEADNNVKLIVLDRLVAMKDYAGAAALQGPARHAGASGVQWGRISRNTLFPSRVPWVSWVSMCFQ